MYNVWLCTLDDVRAHRRLATDETTDDALIKKFIVQASMEFCAAVRRTPIVYFAERRFDYSPKFIKNSRKLFTDEDLLAVTAIENGNGAAITPASTLMQPPNVWPKYGVLLTSDAWVHGDYREQCIGITGWWGYVPHYHSAWQRLMNVPADELTNATDTTIDVGEVGGTLFEVGQYLLVDDEIMQVTANETVEVEESETDIITVERGMLGTTAAVHASGVPIKAFVQLEDIRAAVIEMAVYKYKSKDRIGGRVTVFDNSSVAVEDVDRSVYETRDRHLKHELLFR